MSSQVESPQTKDERVSKGASDAPSKEEGCGLSPYDVPGDWIDLIGTGQIKKKVLKKGSQRRRPRKYDYVEVNYEIYSGGREMVQRRFNHQFQLGDAEVIQGLEIGISWMEWQEVALLQVESKFAYGSLGSTPSTKNPEDQEPRIPGDTLVVFMVELLCFAPEPDPSKLPLNQLLQTAFIKKERGNWWYKRNEYYLAIKCYRRADEYIKEKEQEMTDEMRAFQIVLWNNLTTALLKMKAYDMALIYSNQVLKQDPDNKRAQFLHKQILMEKGLKEVSEMKPEEWEKRLMHHLEDATMNYINTEILLEDTKQNNGNKI